MGIVGVWAAAACFFAAAAFFHTVRIRDKKRGSIAIMIF
jgi:hypothetical protein